MSKRERQSDGDEKEYWISRGRKQIREAARKIRQTSLDSSSPAEARKIAHACHRAKIQYDLLVKESRDVLNEALDCAKRRDFFAHDVLMRRYAVLRQEIRSRCLSDAEVEYHFAQNGDRSRSLHEIQGRNFPA